MRAVLFANGVLSHPEVTRRRIRSDDWLIAADGGARHCKLLGLIPAVLIGDLDSIHPREIQTLEQAGSTIVPHPARKDQTDLELALAYALENKADEVMIIGGLGERWDQSLANILLPTAPNAAGVDIRFVDGNQEISFIRGGETIELQGQPGDTISLIPLGGDASGLTSIGLEYPLANDTLRFGTTRGVSNIIVKKRASLHLKQGLLACIMIHSHE